MYALSKYPPSCASRKENPLPQRLVSQDDNIKKLSESILDKIAKSQSQLHLTRSVAEDREKKLQLMLDKYKMLAQYFPKLPKVI
ncbi:MAG: hypothetical protein K2X39_07310, partial [Silvanigrellaceae bacterium]|nr:hypothetical protein [Silvanigrellaceae bacterium]